MFDFCIYLSSLVHILELVNIYSFCYGLYIVFFLYFVITVFSQVQLEGVKKLLEKEEIWRSSSLSLRMCRFNIRMLHCEQCLNR